MAWLALVVAACTPPDRSAEVRRLQAEIANMPGVDDVNPLYTNDFENGAQLSLVVAMPKASEEQIAAVASRITRIKGGDFNDYRQSCDFVVGDRLEVKRGAKLDPAQIAGDAHRLRQLRARVPQGSILWSRDGATARLEVSDTDHTSDVLNAALATVQPESMTVYVRSAEPTKFPTWEVGVPITAEQRANVDALISRLAMPVYYVRVDDARITALSVYITDPATAYRDLKSVISTVAPTKQHPLQLQWHLIVEPDNFHQFTGDLQVPDCRDGSGSPKPQGPQGNQTAEAAELQRQLNRDFSDCR
ncbi:hypothetical protein [Mycobacterium sp. 1245852.3]|uniref:hypothetical protein n=1 Tax=Mycobacterium sp. 1245852.3 TaxID=1856860 RepID=UPI0007FCF904|nr:hypothetical protein [Mycobacterium sp. 1245852.3]OBK12822.1 hypothetical protein A9W96_10375 [Mycobacterium sp. 1245852.3]